MSHWLVRLRDDPARVVEVEAFDLAPRLPVMTSATLEVPVSADPADVCVESGEENMVSAMALHAHCLLPGTWNGWARPVATAREVADFLARWRRNDPNGVWGYAVDVDGALLVTRSDAEDPDRFAGKARMHRLRHQLLCVPASVIHHARSITLRLPPGDHVLAEVLSRLRELPDPA